MIAFAWIVFAFAILMPVAVIFTDIHFLTKKKERIEVKVASYKHCGLIERAQSLIGKERT